VETSPGNFQAWLKHAFASLPGRHRRGKILAEKFGGDPNSADWRHFGDLPLYNPKPQYRLQMGSFLLATQIRLSKGVIYKKTHEVLSEVEDRCSINTWNLSGLSRHALVIKTSRSESELLDYPTSPTNMPRTANGTRQTLPTPPTLSSEAYPKSRSAITFGPYLYIRLRQPLPTRPGRLYRSHVNKALKQNGLSFLSSPPSIPRNSAANRFRLSVGGRLAVLLAPTRPGSHYPPSG